MFWNTLTSHTRRSKIMDEIIGSFLEWLIAHLGTFFINEYRGCAVAFYGVLCLTFLGGMIASFIGVLQGQLAAAVGIVGCLIFVVIFGWLLYRAVTSPTWPPL